MSKLLKLIGANIAKCRKGITQEDLAVAVGLSRASIVNIEKGRQGLTIVSLYKIASALNVVSTF